MLRKAQQYLVARGKLDWTDLPAAVPTLRRSESLGWCGAETFFWRSLSYCIHFFCLFKLISFLFLLLFIFLKTNSLLLKKGRKRGVLLVFVLLQCVFLLAYSHMTFRVSVSSSSSEKPEAVSWRPDPSPHQQSHPGAERRAARTCTCTGRRPIIAQCPVPWGRRQRGRRGIWAGKASRSAAGEERRLLHRHLL